MTVSDDPMVCADIEGLLCLSDLADFALQPPCTPEQTCLHFFPGMGFRPAAWAQERDQYGDRAILIVSGDDTYLAKYDGPLDIFAFLPEGLEFSLPATAIIPNLLATPTSGTSPSYSLASFGGFPGFFGGSGGGRNGGGGGNVPNDPSGKTPPGGGGETTTGGGGELPPLAAVPLSGSGLFLIVALAALMIKVGHRKLLTQIPKLRTRF